MGLTMSSHSTAEQLKSAAVAPGALFLDVRNDAEVKESPLTSRPYLHVSCMPDDCSELTARADELLPDKNGTYDTTSYVMTFFRSVRPSGEDWFFFKSRYNMISFFRSFRPSGEDVLVLLRITPSFAYCCCFFPLSPMQLLLYLTSAPVIVFCRSGRRAGKAKETLEQLGYTKVLNAGGLEDLVSKLE